MLVPRLSLHCRNLPLAGGTTYQLFLRASLCAWNTQPQRYHHLLGSVLCRLPSQRLALPVPYRVRSCPLQSQRLLSCRFGGFQRHIFTVLNQSCEGGSSSCSSYVQRKQGWAPLCPPPPQLLRQGQPNSFLECYKTFWTITVYTIDSIAKLILCAPPHQITLFFSYVLCWSLSCTPTVILHPNQCLYWR